jgi:predicted MPP superfamily phosphohydrolase
MVACVAALDLSVLWIVTGLAFVIVPIYAGGRRGRTYGVVAALTLALSLPGALFAHGRLVSRLGPEATWWLDVAFCWGAVAVAVHLASLVTARLRSPLFRAVVSIPGLSFAAAGALAGPWLLALLPVRATVAAAGGGTGIDWLAAVPFVLVAVSLVTTFRPVAETVRFTLDDTEPTTLRRLPLERHRHRHRHRPPPPPARRPLRLVQIADPHLGPWQSVAALRRRIERLLAHDPDLVLLTGDFLTMEGQGTPGALAQALAPLQRMPGRCIAVLGNHDHESPREVRAALAACGVTLLVDDATIVDTPVGPVQIVGADWVGRGCRDHLQALLARYPRRPGHLRLLLLHDPRGFRFVPKGGVDLTLSGHTHGGQIGLVSVGLDWTVLSRSRWPDHGLFGHGPNRLYVHRGTGFYGFPLRIGVPGELSVLEVLPGAPHVADLPAPV